MFKALAKKAGIKKHVTSYVARHSFSVGFIENGGRIENLSVILGHTNILITSKIYGRISDKRQSEMMQEQQQKSKVHQLSITNNNTLVAV